MSDGEIKAMLHGHMGRRRQGRARSRLALAEISADAATTVSGGAAGISAGSADSSNASVDAAGVESAGAAAAAGRSQAETAQIPVVDEGEGR